MKLDLGGAGKLKGKDGWFTINCGYDADITMDITSEEFDNAFPNKSIEYMLCSHTIEHLMCNKTRPALKMWHRKLIAGGVLEIICPDAQDIVLRHARGEVPWLTVMNVLYGVPEWLDANPYNQHLYGFSFESLAEIVSECGFDVVERRNRSWVHNYANEEGQPHFGTFSVNDLHVVCQAR